MGTTSFYTEEELAQLGLKSYGKDVMISRKCSIYGAGNISLGNHVRIDDFCILSGNITIHDYVHISAYASMFAGESRIEIGDYVAISSRNAIYAESDDYSGESMVNPLVPEKCRKVQKGDVFIGKHVIIGTGGTVLPGVTVGEGASVGAMSLINKDIEPWTVNVGIPCKKVKERSRKLLEYEKYIPDKNIE
ncbi:MAG: acyltransferase [Butyribacter sp.]|nr:acyltransferase [bacterium]MDY3853812.1 acyltransferase [Butyribacter sp.]